MKINTTRIISLGLFLAVGALVGLSPSHAQEAASSHPIIEMERSLKDGADYDGILLTVKEGTNTSNISLHGLDSAKAVQGTSMVTVQSNNGIADEDLEALLMQFEKDPTVIAAQPNFRYYPTTTPDDTYFNDQWALENTGQVIGGSTGLFDFDLDGPTTWSLEDVANPIVTVAVIDTGVDPSHPDLVGNLVAGYDFTESDANPYDYHGHGTHVAGIIAATSNNSLGISGVSIKNRIKVMPLKTVNFTTAELVAAVNYAQANSVDVINASWGGGEFDPALYAAINNFSGLFVAAAGNDNSDNDAVPHYPASYALDNIVAVGSYANNGYLSSFTNYGSTVDVNAPGTHVLSTYPLFTPLAEENFTSISLGTDLSGTPFTETSGDWGVINPSCSGCDNGLTIGTTRSYVNNASDILTLTTPVDASLDTEPPVLKFYLNASIQYSASCTSDYLAIESDNNNDVWAEVTRICGGWDNDLEIQLPTADSTLRFRFKWITDSSTTGTAPFIDDIELLSYGVVNHGYAYLSGTSMASPYVAGEIAMIMSETPGLSNADLKDLVMVSKHNGMTNMLDGVINSSTVFDTWHTTAGVASTALVGTVFNSDWYQAVIGVNNRAYFRNRDTVSEWPRWAIIPSYIDDTPALASFDGCLNQSVKGGNNKIYNSKSCDGTTWSAWTEDGGYTPSAPALATFNGRLYQSVRGGDNKIYNRYSTDGTTWSDWVWEEGKSGYAPSMVEYNSHLYQTVVGLNSTQIYVRKMDTGFNWGPWTNTGGSAASHIAMEVYNGRLYQSYANTDTKIYIRSYSTVTDWTDGAFMTGSTREIPSLKSFNSTFYQSALGGGGTLYERVIK